MNIKLGKAGLGRLAALLCLFALLRSLGVAVPNAYAMVTDDPNTTENEAKDRSPELYAALRGVGEPAPESTEAKRGPDGLLTPPADSTVPAEVQEPTTPSYEPPQEAEAAQMDVDRGDEGVGDEPVLDELPLRNNFLRKNSLHLDIEIDPSLPSFSDFQDFPESVSGGPSGGDTDASQVEAEPQAEPEERPVSQAEGETEEFRPQIVSCTFQQDPVVCEGPVRDSDSDDEGPEVHCFARNNIVDAPRIMIDWIMGEHVTKMAEPAILLNVWPALDANEKKVAKIVGMDLVDAKCVLGSYYRMRVKGSDEHGVTFLVGRNAAEEIANVKEGFLRPRRESAPELIPRPRKPDVRRKMSITESMLEESHKKFLEELLDPGRGPDEPDTPATPKPNPRPIENPFRKYYRSRGYGRGNFTPSETTTSATATASDPPSAPMSTSSGGVGILMGEFSEDDSPNNA